MKLEGCDSRSQHRRGDSLHNRRNWSLRDRRACCRWNCQYAAAAETSYCVLLVTFRNGNIQTAIAAEAHVAMIPARRVVAVATSLYRAFIRRRADGLLRGGLQRARADDGAAFGAVVCGFIVSERRTAHRTQNANAVFRRWMRGENAVGFTRRGRERIDDEHRRGGLAGKTERLMRLRDLFQGGRQAFGIACELGAGSVGEILAFAGTGEIEQLRHDGAENY